MLTRAASAALLLLLVAGCAANTGDQAGGAPEPAPASSSGVIDPSLPALDPSIGPGGAGKSPDARPKVAQTVTGTVSAGVEPNCLLLTAGGASYQLVFDDPAMRSDAPVGKKVTVMGKAEPGMMSTCQQGVPFIVAAVRPAT